jgi:cytosine/adenosine deaminase-related metal-dependent hydrolase
MSRPEVLLRGGRVIDPESGFDAMADVAIDQGRITRIGAELSANPVGGGASDDPATGPGDVDVAGLVVTAGFVDLHSHVTDLAGMRLQALDGVTTALELEAGASPVAAAYRNAAADGRPTNYGFATSWAQARMDEIAGFAPGAVLADFLSRLGDPRWQQPAEAAQLSALLSRMAADLADGALGIGVLLGYAPTVEEGEYLRVAALAAEAGVPAFTHARDLIEMVPNAAVDGAEEIVRAAGQTGARMHYCHVNSTSQRHVERVLRLVGRAQEAGARISTEAYPYGSGMTAIGAAFLAPERLGERGLAPSSLTYAPTGERVASEERLRELRKADPGGLALIKLLDEDDPADRALLMRSLTFPGAVVASDAMPLTWTGAGARTDPAAWPPSATAITHPRTAGTFSRAVRLLTRGHEPLSLAQALSKCSLEPARLLEDRVPAMRRKGRLQVGADADVLVFDPIHLTDQATYTHTTRPSAGVRHVLVNGTFVVRDGEIVPEARPGRPVRAEPL